jgi:hypothetical protein
VHSWDTNAGGEHGQRDIDEHWFPAIHYNRLRSSPISISIGATISREALLGFYCTIDYAIDCSEDSCELNGEKHI